jgi:hypothetical protein
MTDQSLLNYVWFRLAQERRITLAPAHFMILARTPEAGSTPLADIAARRAPPRLFHWAGEHKTFLGLMKRSDLLRFFERWYYAGLPGGTRLRVARSLRAAPGNAGTWAYLKAGNLKRSLRPKRA